MEWCEVSKKSKVKRLVIDGLHVRIPGASGACFELDQVAWVGNVGGVCVAAPRFDITFTDQDRVSVLRNREVTLADQLMFRDFLKEAMSADIPQVTVSKFESPTARLQAGVGGSDDYSLELTFEAAQFVDDDTLETDGVMFRTPRAALWEPLAALNRHLGFVDDLIDLMEGP